MNRPLADLLAPLEPVAVESVTWPGVMHSTVATYLHDAPPPDAFTTSVRAVVITDSGVALFTNPDERHILPGGRREPGELLDQTLRRELLEEIGCEIEEASFIGFLHFHHETPRPALWTGPYPDFVQVIFAVRGRQVQQPDALDPDGREQSVEFVPDEKLRPELRPGEAALLDRALEALFP